MKMEVAFAPRSSGKPGVEYTYTTSTSDPDGDQVYYWFDWDDGSIVDGLVLIILNRLLVIHILGIILEIMILR